MGKKILLGSVLLFLAMFSSRKISAQQIDTVIQFGACTNMGLWVHTSTNNNVSVTVDFGDGTSDSLSVDSAGIYPFYHSYYWPGTYPQVVTMFQNNIPVDTLYRQYVRDTFLCPVVYNYFYHDMDNDCVKDTNELFADLDLLVEIAKNSVPIDTVQTQNGFFYMPQATVGDVFTFKVISAPPDVTVACPMSGSISNTMNYGPPHHNWFGLDCVNATYDLGVHAISSGLGLGVSFQTVSLKITNNLCDDISGTVTFIHSNKYPNVHSADPAPSSISGNTLTWNFNNLGVSSGNTKDWISVTLTNTTPLVMGDTVHSTFMISPTTGDVNLANNMVFTIDTVTLSWDPNAIYVKPEGCVAAGTNLEYTITFENLGNGPAEHVYVLDTLPAGLEESSIKTLFSSHNMFVGKRVWNGHTILKFDFPNIMLADSSDHEGRHGMFKYKIDTKNTLSVGSSFDHRVGIYFDTNPVVLTNAATTEICWPASVSETVNGKLSSIYPNPAYDELLLDSEGFDNYEITNNLGQHVTGGQLQNGKTKLNIKQLVPGLYYIRLSGSKDLETQKFQKL